MATLALLAKPSLMNVLAIVATGTGIRRQHLVAGHRLLMAIGAFGLLVGSVNPVLGAFVVVEIPDFPVAGIVATLALLAQTQFVLVFLLMARPAIRLGVLEFRRFMALLAVGLDMLAQQREFRLVVVEAHIVALPASFVMAILALLALLTVVLVVHFVTGIAVRWCLVAIDGRGMTLLALGIPVLEFQWILGVLVVIEPNVVPLPALFVVAFVTLVAQVATVSLVVVRFLVAVVAHLRQLLLIELAGVTLVALDLEVLEAQWIFGVLVVIEEALFPVTLLVAIFALLAEIALVRLFIIFLMAGPAVERQRLVFLPGGMALVALGFLVLILERELGVLVMIETLGRLPVMCAVAFLALFSQRTAVLVVLLVTGNAGSFEFLGGLVAT